MRPVDKGASPGIFDDYADAKPHLTARLGTYCSYCERQIATNLAVEHILPKDPSLGYAHLRNEWENFLLACVNCNSAKLNQVLTFEDYLLPDRDNTFPYYNYVVTGEVEVIADDPDIAKMAQNTLELVALNNTNNLEWDEEAMFTAIERVSQRVQRIQQANEAKEDFEAGNVTARRLGAEAASSGFFSIWMNVFEEHVDVRKAIIKAYQGTAADCFDSNTNPITPRPDNGLEEAGKA